MLTLPVVMLFPALWAMSPSRWTAAYVSAGYFLAASRGLPQGVANFYAADLLPGILLWAVASLAFVVPHVVLWKRQRQGGRSRTGRTGRGRAVCYLAAMVLTGLPPFGITGWAHPLTATGVLFPGWGWWGVFAAAIALLVMTTRVWPAAAITLVSFWLWSATTWTQPKLPEGWTGVDLELGQRLGRDGSLGHHRDLITRVRRAASAKAGTRVVVLPESTLGFWTPTVESLWREGLRGSDVTVLAGAAILKPQGYENAMVAISANTAHIAYRERMPVPVSMWQPWLSWTGQGGGARANLFGNPAVEIEGVRAAPLICYEQLILWPVLQSMLHSPAAIVAMSNVWWTEGTKIAAIQRANTIAWAKLFGVPLVLSFNR